VTILQIEKYSIHGMDIGSIDFIEGVAEGSVHLPDAIGRHE
jgi:hypothetical protein